MEISTISDTTARHIHGLDDNIQNMDTSLAPPLLPILRSRQQAELLTLLLGNPDLEVTVTELAGRLDIPYASAHREVERAETAGIVASRRIGRSRLVRADTTSPYFDGLAQILVRSFGVVPTLAAVLAAIDGIAAAYVFGSWATRFLGVEGNRPVGDLDVLVLGEPDRDRLYEAAHHLEARLGRPVQVTVRDADWLTAGSGSFHDAVTTQPLIPIPLLVRSS